MDINDNEKQRITPDNMVSALSRLSHISSLFRNYSSMSKSYKYVIVGGGVAAVRNYFSFTFGAAFLPINPSMIHRAMLLQNLISRVLKPENLPLSLRRR